MIMNKPARGLTSRNELMMGLLLLLILIVTRSGISRSHFGTHLNLPDASWAVFWLTGALTVKRWWPAVLMIACVAVDYWVIAGGVSDYCFTPAYPFLIPAYFSLWAMGGWSRAQLPVRSTSILSAALSLFIGVSACFLISNLGFYLSSGYFGAMSALHYAQAVSRYFPHYLLTTSAYAVAGVLIHYVVKYRSVKAAGRRAH
jgi:hypothetical protein